VSPGGSPRSPRAAGFTLIETLVALAILGVVLTTVFGIFGGALRAAHRDEDRLLLALVAENLLARSRLDLFPAEGAFSGDIGGGLRWRIEGEPYALPENLLPEASPEAEQPDLLGGGAGEAAAGDRPGDDGLGDGAHQAGDGFGGGGSAGYGGRTSSSLGGGSSSSSFGQGDARGGGLGDAREPTSGAGRSPLGDTAGDRPLGGGAASGDDRPGQLGDQQPREREKVRLRLITVTVEKGGERFQLTGLAPEPSRDRRPLLR
jgi:type II secretion system protein I